MDIKSDNRIEEVIITHLRRLRILQLREAMLGVNTPPEILMEIEDIESKVEKLKSQRLTPAKSEEFISVWGDPEREFRLIQALKSDNIEEVKRSMLALNRLKNPWFVSALREFVVGNQEQLAELAIHYLVDIPGSSSATAIAEGLESKFQWIRQLAALSVGEIALHGRGDDSLYVLDKLKDSLKKSDESVVVLKEIVHSLGKIGRGPVLQTGILRSDAFGFEVKGLVLYELSRRPRYDRDDRRHGHDREVVSIIRQWPIELCFQLKESSSFTTFNPLWQDVIEVRTRNK